MLGCFAEMRRRSQQQQQQQQKFRDNALERALPWLRADPLMDAGIFDVADDDGENIELKRVEERSMEHFQPCYNNNSLNPFLFPPQEIETTL